jgi:hypothetical protein
MIHKSTLDPSREVGCRAWRERCPDPAARLPSSGPADPGGPSVQEQQGRAPQVRDEALWRAVQADRPARRATTMPRSWRNTARTTRNRLDSLHHRLGS